MAGCGTGASLVPQAPVDELDTSSWPGPVLLTPKAVEMVRDAMQRESLEGYGLRVSVMGGGCSGFQYGLDFENDEKAMDLTYEVDGLKIFIDPMSSQYLEGTTIDYVQSLQGAGFKFINPKAVRTCGCGASFSA
jgi:iron-sulfur cluster assembly accessory protein